ncbi:AI-2E family transporter [Stakelama marina]|uniref:AI-2E family transporter n=1 Tax=Stakelama marina TaxID=2826939 RepID=A0A8T4IGE7_9SPHN|nr:AI-2E family transporter [Stakelama marina]MBR0551306.1 AI-2E family transporter [Stakelama marina]
MADREDNPGQIGPGQIRPARSTAALSRTEFAARAAIVIAFAATAVALWQLRTVMMLAFAAILVGVLLDGMAALLAGRLGWQRRFALAAVVLSCAVIVLGGIVAFGTQVHHQVDQLIAALPSGWTSLQARARDIPALGQLLTFVGTLATPDRGAQAIGSILSGLVNVLGGLLLAAAGGIYLAAQPDLYRRGLLALVPASNRERAAEILDSVAAALHHWLAGQIVVMLFVGLLTGLGAWAIGLPSPLALGVVAGLLEFIPYAGPILTAVPALLLAATVGLEAMVLTLVLLVAVQQVEGYVLTPLVQRRATALPPLLTLFALFAAGTLLGTLGILLAVPLTVALYTALRAMVGEARA